MYFFIYFSGEIGGASRGRICFQWGLPIYFLYDTDKYILSKLDIYGASYIKQLEKYLDRQEKVSWKIEMRLDIRAYAIQI